MTLAGTRTELTTSLVDWDDADATRLRAAQVSELAERYGSEDDPSVMTAEGVVAMLLVRDGDEPVACGALRDVSATQGSGTVEIKRLYVVPARRGRGLSRLAMAELEARARTLGYGRLILETGVMQPEAIGLYLALGYDPIEAYGEYKDHPGSRCFGKALVPDDGGGETDVPRDEAGTSRRARPEVTLRFVDWDDADAVALRLAMYERTNARLYPSLREHVEQRGGFAVDDAAQGVGALTTVLAELDGVPVGCATLRAARPGYPAGSGELKKVFVDERARGAGVARTMLQAIEDSARDHRLTQVVLMTGYRQPEAIRLYVSSGYRPILPLTPRDRVNPHGLWFAKHLG
ncbi:GNAT family N-acetyltransferase [Cellulomonas cellasea]|uniref:GNAT superfamily N-acetyltransferase n=1 Tax=Cellulomonas cellasea TaxID=43670 RepID=A0A7W4UKX9_9CELL|nr:GNAT family N-acetyltransferase [Cellulomonas cellasea]MBB2925458.1 GNAT superfamily N-acetyltransferase [Cellulomonas cellasea]